MSEMNLPYDEREVWEAAIERNEEIRIAMLESAELTSQQAVLHPKPVDHRLSMKVKDQLSNKV